MTHIITLSLLILAVIIIRAAFRRHVSPLLIYSLWLVVLLKLCMPFSLFEVTLPSFITSPSEVTVGEEAGQKLPTGGSAGIGESGGEIIAPTVSTDEIDIGVQTSPVIVGSDTANEITPISPTPGVDKEINNTPQIPDRTPTDAARPSLPKISFTTLCKIAWGIGSLALAAVFSVSGLSFYTKIRRDRKRVGKMGRIKVYVSDNVGTSSLVGLFAPSVYLTPRAKESESLSLILLHEKTHLRHGDHIWSIIRTLAVILLWWNPLVWAAAILSKQDAELACDYSVLLRAGEKKRFDYARVIVDMLPIKRSPMVGLAGGSVRQRIKMMTEKHKNRFMAALLAVVLALSAIGCSFIGSKVAENTEDTRENSGDISEIVLDPDEYFTVIENAANLEFVAVPYPIGDARGVRYSLYDNCWVYMSYELYDETEGTNEIRFHVFDVEKGSFVSSRPFYSVNGIPSTISYTENGCILFDSRKDEGTKDRYIVDCAFEIAYKDGELSVEEREHDMFPMCERYITSPDGKYSLLKMTWDGYNRGGIDVKTPERMFTPFTNIMLDDEIDGGKAGIQQVRGYTPVGFIDETKFLYTVGGWEWTIGYGIYDIETGENKEYLEGYGVVGLGEDGSFYICEVDNYEYKNIWKTNIDEEFELIATTVVDGETDAFPLYGSFNWTHQGDAWYAYDLEYSIVRPDSDERSKVSVYPIDFSEKLTTFEARTADLNNGLYLYGDKLYMIVRIDENEKTELAEEDVNEVIETLINKLTRKAVQYYPIDCSVYLDNDPAELKTLIEYGDDTLLYLYNIFNHNINISPDHGVIMQGILVRMLGDEAKEYDTDQPYKYFNLWREDVVLMNRTLGDEKMEKDYPKSQLLIEFLRELFVPDTFSEHFPNSRAITKFYHKIFASDTYIYFCEDYKDPKEYYIYYTSDYGKTIGAISAEIPADIEYDSAKPIYVGGGGGSGECEFVFELTNGGETFYIRFDNFSYTNFEDWLKFEYRGIVDETYVGERLGVNYDDSAKRTLKTSISAGSGNKLIDLIWYEELGCTVVEKSKKANDEYPENEKYLWHIEQVFDNGSVLLYVGGERNSQNEWYLLELDSGKVIDIFKDVPDEIIDSAFYVHCSDDTLGVVFWCNKGEKAYYFDRTSGKCTDVAELTGLEGATHAYIVGEGKLFVTAFSYEQNKTLEGGCYDTLSGEFGKFIEDGKVIWTQLDTEELICFENNTKYGLIRLDSEYAFIDLHNGDFNWSKTDIGVGDLKLPFGDEHFVSISSAHYGDKIYVSLYRTDYGVLLNETSVDLSGMSNRSYSIYENEGAKYLLIRYTDQNGKAGKRLVYIG